MTDVSRSEYIIQLAAYGDRGSLGFLARAFVLTGVMDQDRLGRLLETQVGQETLASMLTGLQSKGLPPFPQP